MDRYEKQIRATTIICNRRLELFMLFELFMLDTTHYTLDV